MASKYNKTSAVQPRAGGPVMVEQTSMVSGPLPPAEEFDRFEKALSGTGDRILKLAEKEAAERHFNTRKLVNGQAFQSYAGPVFGFLVAVLALLLGYDLTVRGHEVTGFTALAIGAGTLVGSFVSLVRKPRKPNDSQ